MAIRFFDGLDLYADATALGAVWGIGGTTPTFSTTGGRFGGGSFTCTANDSNVSMQVHISDLYVTIGAAVKIDSFNTNLIMGLTESSAPIATSTQLNGGIEVRPGGVLALVGDGVTTVATSDAGVVSTGNWYFIELQMNVASSGLGAVYVNGVQVCSGTGDFFDGPAPVYAFFGHIDFAGNTTYDDLYIASDASSSPAALGDIKIATLLPNAGTAQADWTGAYTDIDDALGTNGDGDTTFISATTVGNKSEFEIENLAESPTAVHAIAVTTQARKTDAGAITYRNYVDSGGTESAGATVGPSESGYDKTTTVFETDPATAVAWTEAGVNAVKVGVEIVS